MGHYKIKQRELLFVLKEQLRYGRLCKYDRYKDLTEDALDMVVKEGIPFAHGVIEPLQELAEEFGVKYEDGRVYCLPEFKEAFKKCGENGWIGLVRDTAYGGQGFPLMMRIVMNELFYGACQCFNVLPSLTHGAGHLIESFGTEDLKKRFVPRMYAGEWSGAMALTEPEAGSNLANIQTEAKREGDRFKIKGNKIFITYSEHDIAENIIILTLARIEGAPEGVEGISLFIVPKIRVTENGKLAEANDIKCIGVEKKMGLKGAPTAAISFGERDECIGVLCGQENKGLSQMFQMINQGRINSAVTGMTLASTAYLNALDYCKRRIQGADLAKRKPGNVPIIDHPDIRRMLLWMKAVVEGLRSMVYFTAFCSDIALCAPDLEKKGHYEDLLDFMTPIVKAYSTQMGFEVCSTAMQCYGGHGYMCDYPIEAYLRDVRAPALYEGTNGIQALDLSRRKLTMKNGAALQAFVKEVKSFIDDNRNQAKFRKEIQGLDQTLNQIKKVSLKLSAKWRTDPLQPASHSFPLLLCFGDVMLVWRLLDMAVIADKALSDGSSDKNFYIGKIKAATYLARELLPQTQARLNTRLSESREILEIENSQF